MLRRDVITTLWWGGRSEAKQKVLERSKPTQMAARFCRNGLKERRSPLIKPTYKTATVINVWTKYHQQFTRASITAWSIVRDLNLGQICAMVLIARCGRSSHFHIGSPSPSHAGSSISVAVTPGEFWNKSADWNRPIPSGEESGALWLRFGSFVSNCPGSEAHNKFYSSVISYR